MQSMRMAVLSLNCLLLALAGTAAAHPAEKVITLLQGLSQKVEAEAKTEAVAYDKFEHWCRNSEKTLEAAIAEEKASIDTLKTQIAGEEKTVTRLESEISALKVELVELGNAASAAESQRADGARLFEQASSDLNLTVAALAQAISGLEASRGTQLSQWIATPRVRQALALAGVGSRVSSNDADSGAAKFSIMASSLLQNFAAQRPDLKARGDRVAHVKEYNFKSDDVIELLKELQRRFEDELLAATQAETNALNAYELEAQARAAVEKATEVAKLKKTSTYGDVSQALIDHKKNLDDTEQLLADDSHALAETQKACQVKKQEWEARSAVRSDELEAMKAAIEILSKITGVRTEAPTNPIPPAAPTDAEAPASFLQLSNSNSDPRRQALTLLRSRAQAMHSKVLARMAQELAAHLGGPFDEVNNMIEKMIFRLSSEQTDEDNHKHWCDQELSTSNISKIDKESKISMLSMKIDSAKATVQQLSMDIKEANDMIAKIDAFVGEATEIRQVGKSENAEALKDALDAQTAIAEAVAVLTDYYKKTGMVKKEAWEFAQLGGKGVELPEKPATWDAGYTGVSDPMAQPSGIITVLEKVASGFATMEADTRAQEATDQKAYDEQMKVSAIEKAERSKEVEMKGQEKKRVSDRLAAMEKTRKQVDKELDAVNQYLQDLEPACLQGDATYEDRKAARAKEIQALKEAESILAKAFEEKAEDAAPAPSAFFQAKALQDPAPRVKSSMKFMSARPHAH